MIKLLYLMRNWYKCLFILTSVLMLQACNTTTKQYVNLPLTIPSNLKTPCIDPSELKSIQGGAVYEALMGNTYGLLECKLRHQSSVDVVSLYQFTEYTDD